LKADINFFNSRKAGDVLNRYQYCKEIKGWRAVGCTQTLEVLAGRRVHRCESCNKAAVSQNYLKFFDSKDMMSRLPSVTVRYIFIIINKAI